MPSGVTHCSITDIDVRGEFVDEAISSVFDMESASDISPVLRGC